MEEEIKNEENKEGETPTEEAGMPTEEAGMPTKEAGTPTKEEPKVEDAPKETLGAGDSPEEISGREEKPLDKMTVKELRDVARVIPGVTGTVAMKKDELLALIKESRGIKDKKPVKKKVKKSPGKEITPGDLKKNIIRLREQKEAARGAREMKKVDVLRRRINRLKKQTRKTVLS